jgi:hypothetical protein
MPSRSFVSGCNLDRRENVQFGTERVRALEISNLYPCPRPEAELRPAPVADLLSPHQPVRSAYQPVADLLSPHQPVRSAYQPPASNTFLSEQTSHQQSASSTFLSEQISTSHQTPAKRTGCKLD